MRILCVKFKFPDYKISLAEHSWFSHLLSSSCRSCIFLPLSVSDNNIFFSASLITFAEFAFKMICHLTKMFFVFFYAWSSASFWSYIDRNFIYICTVNTPQGWEGKRNVLRVKADCGMLLFSYYFPRCTRQHKKLTHLFVICINLLIWFKCSLNEDARMQFWIISAHFNSCLQSQNLKFGSFSNFWGA